MPKEKECQKQTGSVFLKQLTIIRSKYIIQLSGIIRNYQLTSFLYKKGKRDVRNGKERLVPPTPWTNIRTKFKTNLLQWIICLDCFLKLSILICFKSIKLK